LSFLQVADWPRDSPAQFIRFFTDFRDAIALFLGGLESGF